MWVYTHSWKVSNTYSWRHAELHMEQHVKEMGQILQSHRTRLQGVYLTYMYLRDQLDKGCRSHKIEDKMNKELRSELETQGYILKTTGAEMETFKGAKYATGGGEQSFKMVCFNLG
jgi:hypothetical protein